jgi:hypothetical protein
MREHAKEAASSLLAKVGLQKSKRVLEEEIEAVPSKTIDRSGSGMGEVERE